MQAQIYMYHAVAILKGQTFKMADITLGHLLALILRQMDEVAERTLTPVELFEQYNLQQNSGEAGLPLELPDLQVTSLDFTIPAHLHLQTDPMTSSSTRLTVALPSPLVSEYQRSGRIQVTIAFEPLSQTESES